MRDIWEIARQTFAPGSPGAVLFALMFIAVVGFFLSYIASAVGKGQVARMIDVAIMFAAIIAVAGVAYNAIVTVAKLAGYN